MNPEKGDKEMKKRGEMENEFKKQGWLHSYKLHDIDTNEAKKGWRKEGKRKKEKAQMLLPFLLQVMNPVKSIWCRCSMNCHSLSGEIGLRLVGQAVRQCCQPFFLFAFVMLGRGKIKKTYRREGGGGGKRRRRRRHIIFVAVPCWEQKYESLLRRKNRVGFYRTGLKYVSEVVLISLCHYCLLQLRKTDNLLTSTHFYQGLTKLVLICGELPRRQNLLFLFPSLLLRL